MTPTPVTNIVAPTMATALAPASVPIHAVDPPITMETTPAKPLPISTFCAIVKGVPSFLNDIAADVVATAVVVATGVTVIPRVIIYKQYILDHHFFTIVL